MGYQVYEDRAARDLGVERWAGYGVPAVCDFPTCDAAIDRGMGYRCEDLWALESGVLVRRKDEGCGLHFCGEHLDHNVHGDDVVPKPDTAEWVGWILADESWAEWRGRNPDRVASLRAAFAEVS